MLHRFTRTRRPIRSGVIVTAATVASFTLLQPGGARAEQVAGDPHSPTVAALAGQALTALSTAGSTESGENPVYRRLLLDAAAATADEIDASPRAMQLAWLAADRPHQVALLTALTQLGADYQSMSSDPDEGFDCSGLTSYAWGLAGVSLSRQSGDQIDQAADRDEETAMAGDLVQYPGHVMMYLGTGDAVVHASNPENDVELYILSADRADSVRYGDPTTADA
jgi:cell wall-associated NlpC family hydrolase